ncbi:MAG: hypothetical protein AAGA31_06455 [Bacteroidota bacterium]
MVGYLPFMVRVEKWLLKRIGICCSFFTNFAEPNNFLLEAVPVDYIVFGVVQCPEGIAY